MLTDIEIAQSCQKEKIVNIADKLAIPQEDLELYGNYKAKVDLKLMKDLKDKKDGKGKGRLICTTINPSA